MVNEKGSGTLEIMIAFALLTLAISAFAMLEFGNQSVAADAQASGEALSQAQKMLEDAQALSRSHFDSVAAIATTSEGVHDEWLGVVTLGAYTKQVTSYVSWASGARAELLLLTEIFSDSSAVPRDQCAIIAGGNWKMPGAPVDYSFAMLYGMSGFTLTDLAIRDHTLYLTADVGPKTDKNTFFIFSLSDQDPEPVFIKQTDTISPGLAAVAITVVGAKVYAFVASESTIGQLQVIDVTDPSSPSVLYTVKVAGMKSGSAAVGRSIYYDNGYAYLGLTSAGGKGPEFHIFDARDLSKAPIEVGSWPSSSLNHTINSIYVSGEYAYLATDDNTKELTILNVSDKTHPTWDAQPTGGMFDAPGSTGFGYGYAVDTSDGKAYLGRSFVNNAPEFYVLDDTDPSSYPSALPVLGSTSTAGSANALFVRNDLAFVLTKTQLRILDISSPDTMRLSSVVEAGGIALGCTEEFLYVASSTQISAVAPGP